METSGKNEKKVKVTLNRINNFEYFFGFSDKDGLRHVAKALTFDNPSPFAYSSKIYKFDKRRFTFRIGMLKTLCEYLDSKGVSYDVADYEYEVPEVEIDDRMDGRYVHQRNAVEAFYRRRFGIIVVPTRGGKTFIASEILRIFLMTENEGKFLFLTDNTTLFTQAINDFKSFFERYGGLEIGVIKEGRCELDGRVTIGMIQSVQSILSGRCRDSGKRKDLERYMRSLKFLCVDEVHDNCSDSKLRIYKMMRGLEYQLCLSATPYRRGAFVQNLKLREWSGDVIYEISEEVLRERGVLSEYRVMMLMVDHSKIKYELKSDDYNGLLTAMIHESSVRNKILIKLMELLGRMGLKTLLLFQSVEHGRMVSEMSGVPFISGETDGEVRGSRKREFLDADGGMLLASNIFKKGVTLPQVEVLVNVDGGLEDANTIQRKGRVLGSTESKSRSMIIDFFDVDRAYFGNHSSARLKTYIDSIGENGVDILDSGDDDWVHDAENIIEKWFKGEDCTDMR